jgi:hypothetical protein
VLLETLLGNHRRQSQESRVEFGLRLSRGFSRGNDVDCRRTSRQRNHRFEFHKRSQLFIPERNCFAGVGVGVATLEQRSLHICRHQCFNSSMLKIDRNHRKFIEVRRRRLDEAGYRERLDVQAMIRNSPEQFFAEMGEHLLLITEELRPATFVDDRIDLLAIDPSGAVVIIELKRGNNKLQLLQALAYASMVAKWRPEQLVSLRAALTNRPDSEVEKDLEEFLEGDPDALNEMQRVILIAEAFDFEVLSTAEWLSERYAVDIRCYRLSLSSDTEATSSTARASFRLQSFRSTRSVGSAALG